MYRFHKLAVDTERLELHSDGDLVDVEPQVFALLVHLIENREKVVSKDELIESVWHGRIVSDATLNSRINALRRAVGDTGKAQSIVKTYPKRGFRFIAELEETSGAGMTQNTEETAREGPSIVVLPFQYIAENEDQAYLAQGITEDIVTALSRLRWLFVVSRNTSHTYGAGAQDWNAIFEDLGVDYALSGSVRTAGNEIRVSAQLTEPRSGQRVWAERFDGELVDLFDLQDEIAFSVATHLEPEITRAELERLRRENRPGDLTAWEHYVRALPHLNRLERNDSEAARAELSRAIEVDPEFVLPHVALAWCWALAALHGWCRSGSQALKLSCKHAQNALALDPGDARAFCAMAVADFWSGNAAQAIACAQRALELDPNMADAYGILGSAQAVSGEPQSAILSLESALKGSPRDPIRWFWYHSLANAHFADADYQAALEWADKALQIRPQFPPGHLIKAASFALDGQIEAARREIADIREQSPRYTAARVRRNPVWTDADAFERLMEGARLAGLAR